MSKLKLWLSAFRLRTLPLSVSGIILGSCFAYYNGVFKITVFVLALLVTLSLQILSNLANDYGDGVKGTDNNNRIGPERAIQSGKITAAQMRVAIQINTIIAIILILVLIVLSFGLANFFYSISFLILGILSIYAAIKYTVGTSAYGYRALGDLMVFIFFGLLSVMGTYFLYAKQLDYILVLPACTIGLLSAGVLNLNNMRDIVSDKSSNKITVAVLLGWSKAKVYHSILILSAILLTIVFSVMYYSTPLHVIFMITYIPLIKHLKYVKVTNSPKQLDSQLKVLALTTFVFSVLLGLGYLQTTL